MRRFLTRMLAFVLALVFAAGMVPMALADQDVRIRDTAYSETCAAIALVLFASRMMRMRADSKYADCIERVLYNGFLSGISLDGKSFFYENPLEIDPDFNNINYSTAQKERFPITQRLEVFDCSCCPPNIVRFIPSVADHLYTYDSDILYLHQFMDSAACCDGRSH